MEIAIICILAFLVGYYALKGWYFKSQFKRELRSHIRTIEERNHRYEDYENEQRFLEQLIIQRGGAIFRNRKEVQAGDWPEEIH